MKTIKTKTLLFALIFSCNFVFTQNCDTLYSNARYIEQSVEIKYRNCYSLDIDTVYRIVSWTNFDQEFQESYYLKSNYYVLINSLNNKVIIDQWEMLDILYTREYFSNGKMKSFSKSVQNLSNKYYWSNSKEYFENGLLKNEKNIQTRSTTQFKSFYPTGAIQSESSHFDIFACKIGDCIEYYPNGAVSSIRKYPLPNTHDSLVGVYQHSKPISEIFYDKEGNVVDSDKNEIRTMEVRVYPPFTENQEIINDTLFFYHHFKDQKGYLDDMAELKSQILNNLKLKNNCDCNKGVAWISLLVDKKGLIQNIEVEFEDEYVKNEIIKTIQNIKTWSPAINDTENVDVYIYTYLLLDK